VHFKPVKTESYFRFFGLMDLALGEKKEKIYLIPTKGLGVG
jgi:hypothetical protein